MADEFEKTEAKNPKFSKINDFTWEISKEYKKGMKVPARIIATKKLLDSMDLTVFDQIANVAMLPGIQKFAFCMPDGHSGYGFPIGGVAAFDPSEDGVISPGGIGFDINCGMRMVLTNLTIEDVKPRLRELINKLFENVPAGVGSKGFVRLKQKEFIERVAIEGAGWAVAKGYGWKEDLERTELYGCAEWADSDSVSEKAVERGYDQIGTLGSGNHYLEIQHVRLENIFTQEIAKKWGIFKDQIVVMFHCGSRGYGHQIATDYLVKFLSVMEKKYKIKVMDRELACAPFYSEEGQSYYKAMGCAVNMSFANRQVILHRIREVFSDVFHKSPEDLGMHMLFDVGHNRATLEKHEVDGRIKELVVHRKGATGSYYPGREEIPEFYRNDGSPVIIGGSMESGSYLLTAGQNSKEAFCSTAHGSGRAMSRAKARKMVRGEKLIRELEERGIIIKTTSFGGVAEEAGIAYKNIDDVVKATSLAGLSKPVVKLVPLANVKG